MTKEKILLEAKKRYLDAQQLATEARKSEDEDAVEMQYYANASYKKYQQIASLIAEEKLEEAKSLLEETVAY